MVVKINLRQDFLRSRSLRFKQKVCYNLNLKPKSWILFRGDLEVFGVAILESIF